MKMEIKWDKNALDRVVKEATRDAAKDVQRRMDSLSRRCQGRPVDEVKRMLQDDFRRAGGSITEPDLTEWAEALAEGTRIDVRTK